MKNNYELETTKEFDKKFGKLADKDKKIENKTYRVLSKLKQDPFYKGLRTHKVNTKNYGVKYSSRVTSDIRIIWDFANKKLILYIFTIGGHSGKHKVYN